MKYINLLKVEFFNIISNRIFLIVAGITTILQALLGFFNAQNILKVGMDATVETHPELAVSIPPLPFHGMDIVTFGLIAMVVFGAILGANEYKRHNLRSTLLCNSNRVSVFFLKRIAFMIVVVVLSLVSIYLTIAVTHFVYDSQGLHPLLLNTETWKYIFCAVLNWLFLTLLSYELSFVLRNSIYPLLFMVPQVYYFSLNAEVDKGIKEVLPVVAAKNLLFIDPINAELNNPVKGIIILVVFLVVLGLIALNSLMNSDVGGKY